MFEVSAQPDIVRAFQKDAFYEQILCEDVQELLDLAFGGVAVRVQPHIRTVSSFIYYLQSTGHGNRTLGEEYCDILQVCGYSKPGLVRRLAMVVIHVFGPFILENPRRIRIPGSISEMIVQYKDVFEQLSKLHLALFYLYGVYYHISKRLTSIRYLYTGSSGAPRPSYTILGILILLQMIVVWYMAIRDKIKHLKSQMHSKQSGQIIESVPTSIADKEREEEEEVDTGPCSLCLCNRLKPTATECGHVFCWNCICSWTTEKPVCPLCRQPISLSKLVCLVNYSTS